ncbi:Metallo-dependent phosphatase-like protein [Scheffersomyces coipomensis]|uniref:Metallo-dependent phosphatase-like protein n=1 Tax=Scheffersomyces coipomensis TaxID=1788519 RepID=UPI00315C90AC
MLGLPRRWLRQLYYLSGFLVVAIILIAVANQQHVIHIQDYIPISLTPSFFQPSADSYIVDIAIKDCYTYNSGNKNCGVPKLSEGKFGKITTEDIGQWIKIDKDLALGSGWFKKQFFSYKAIQSSALSEIDTSKEEDGNKLVVIDIAISNPSEDSKIKGNEKSKIPQYILDHFHSSKIFGDSDHEDLIEKAKASEKNPTKIDLDRDKENSTSKKLNDLVEKEKAEAEAAEAAKEKEFEEVIAPQDPNNDVVPENEEDNDDENETNDNDKEPESNEESPKEKRAVEISRHDLSRTMYIPSKEEIAKSGWKYKSNGVWLKYGPPSDNAVTGIDILFGEDSVDPRPNWRLIKDGSLTDVNTQNDKRAYLSIRKGDKVNYKLPKYQSPLKVNKNGKFKILQVADLHFSTGVGECRDPVPGSSKKGCEADPRTIQFLEKVLDIEKPDFVVLTGDQIFGETAPDAETAVFKALYPFIKRKIPFAVTLGNHDSEGSLKRSEIMSLSSNLPFSLSSLGPESVDGYGNYVLTVEAPLSRNPAMSLYFLDSHSYSQNPKVNPGYDWIKESQLQFVEAAHADLKKAIDAYTHIHLSMAFFHIPLPEYKNLNQPFIGEHREGITAPRYNTGARAVLGKLGVKVISVGHDHCNDYCLQDIQDKDTDQENKMWLCYGGGVGEGGYGGYGGYVRRLRVFEINTNNAEIKSWKRAENEPERDFDTQILVTDGNVVNY